jgi:hypothetical protein
MATLEALELEKERRGIDGDVAALVKKYLKIMGWDVPEVDMARAKRLVIGEIQRALSQIERET